MIGWVCARCGARLMHGYCCGECGSDEAEESISDTKQAPRRITGEEKMADDTTPAFPMTGDEIATGLTMRDYFATHATERDIECCIKYGENKTCPIDRANARYRHADAMLRARDQ